MRARDRPQRDRAKSFRRHLTKLTPHDKGEFEQKDSTYCTDVSNYADLQPIHKLSVLVLFVRVLSPLVFTKPRVCHPLNVVPRRLEDF
jgi:hypothetical protein